MTMKRPKYDVWLNAPEGSEDGTEPTLHRVELTHGDRLRGELEAAKQGLGPIATAPLHYTTLWCWAALLREGHYKADFRQFKHIDLAEIAGVEDELSPGEQAVSEVDPTQPVGLSSSA